MPSPLLKAAQIGLRAKADHVGATIAGEVSGETRVLERSPTAGAVPERAQDEPSGGEAAVAPAQRRPHAGLTEADDVGRAVTGEVSQQPDVLVDSPPLGLTQIGQDQPRRGERPVAVAQCRPDPVDAESDQIGAAVSGQVRNEARVALHAPALIVPEGHRQARRAE